MPLSTHLAPEKPQPSLPIELKKAILRFCGPGTLAVTARVSLASLELSVSLLHDDVKIQGFETLEKLLCSRTGGPSALDDILALKHIRTLTIICDTGRGDSQTLPIVHLSRLDHDSASIKIGHLTLGLHRHHVYDRNVYYNLDSPDDSRWRNLLPLLDPVDVTLQAFPLVPPPTDLPLYDSIDLDVAPWFRLQSIEFASVTSHDHLGRAEFMHPTDEHAIKVIYQLSETDVEQAEFSTAEMFLNDLTQDGLEGHHMLEPTSGLTEIVVRAQTVDLRDVYRALLESRLLELEMPERARRLGYIIWEVAEEV